MNTKEQVLNPNGYMTFAVAEGLRAHLGRECVRIVTNANVVEQAYEFRPNALVCFDGEEVQYDTILEIRKMGIPVIGWLTEDPYELHTNLRNQDLYDIVFTNERSAVPRYEQGKAAFLPHGASKTSCYYPVRDSCVYDVCIAGTAWPERVEWCRKLRKHLPDVKWKFILHRPQVEVPEYTFPEPLVQTDYRLSINDICRVFNQSKIVISLKRRYSSLNPQIGLSPAPRIFETALSGTAQLVEAVENDEIGEFFEIGREIDTFRSPEDCAEKIASLLRDNSRRREMSAKAQERALRDHSYVNRVIPIIEWIRSQRTMKTITSAPRRLLLCIHSSTESGVFGGMEVQTEELAEQLEPSWSVFLLYPHQKGTKSFWRLIDLSSGRVEEESVPPINEATTYAPKLSAIFKRILLSKQISLVHFQHLYCFPLKLPLAASELGVPYTITWGDYYPVCHKYTLLNNFGVYCHPDEIPIETCDVCLCSTHGYMPGSQLLRRSIVSKIMLRSKGIVCLSQIQRELIGRIFPEVANKMQVVEPLDGPPVPITSNPPNPQGPLNVAITGNFAKQKGADITMLVMNYYKGSPDIDFHILGRIDPEYQRILDRPGLKSAPNVHLLGGYRPSERYSIFDGMHVALFLSIWPEGYPMTLEDLKKAGLPCIASNIGELGRQIEHGVNGWKVPPYDAGPVISILNSIIEDRSVLDSVRAKFRSSLTSGPRYVQRMGGLFEEILRSKKVPMTNPDATIKQMKWLGERIIAYPAETSLWANCGPIPTRDIQAPTPIAQTTAPLATPREALRRLVFYSKQKGIIGTLRIVVEWLRKTK